MLCSDLDLNFSKIKFNYFMSIVYKIGRERVESPSQTLPGALSSLVFLFSFTMFK